MDAVNPVGRLLLSDAQAVLNRQLANRPQPDFAIVFGYWLSPDSATRAEAALVAGDAVQRAGAQQDFHTVASIGLALDIGLLDLAAAEPLRQGLKRLAGRSPFIDGTPMSFCSDAVGILAVAVGCKALGDSAISTKIVGWFTKFLKTIYDMAGTENWQRYLFHAADLLVGGSIGIRPPTSDDISDVRVVLSVKAILPSLVFGDEESALIFIARHATEELSYERAAMRSAALKWLVRSAPIIAPERATVEAIVRLLGRVPAGLRKWTWETAPRTPNGIARRWHIDHEYHVQNLIWMLLAPIFPDLDDEQYLTKIGPKNPRADLYIPSMRLVVEAKFLRASDRIQKVIDEIAADLSLYRALGNECAGVIAFIWDDSARSHEHDYLRQGLKKLPGLIDAVIVSRPSNWPREPETAKSRSKARK
jgi:hypothetical protein